MWSSILIVDLNMKIVIITHIDVFQEVHHLSKCGVVFLIVDLNMKIVIITHIDVFQEVYHLS